MYLSGPFKNSLGGLSSLHHIPDGPLGTKTTLQMMRHIVLQGKTYLPLRNLALSIVQHLPGKQWAREVTAIHSWVKNNIRYVKDVNGVETVSTIPAMLSMYPCMQGDCDDQAVFTAALVESLGHRARFVAAGRNPGHYEHVWSEALVNGKWVAMETTMNWPCGKSAPDLPHKLILEI